MLYSASRVLRTHLSWFGKYSRLSPTPEYFCFSSLTRAHNVTPRILQTRNKESIRRYAKEKAQVLSDAARAACRARDQYIQSPQGDKGFRAATTEQAVSCERHHGREAGAGREGDQLLEGTSIAQRILLLFCGRVLSHLRSDLLTRHQSLDLHQAAKIHLRASLLKVKSIAATAEVAEELRAGIPKTELTPEDKIAFNNVTSALYKYNPVKQAVDRAVTSLCESLDIEDPKKPKKSKTSSLDEEEEEAPPKAKALKTRGDEDVTMVEQEEEEEEEVTDFDGFESDVDEPGPAVGEPDSEAEAKEEVEFAKYDELLGSSSDEDEDEGDDMYKRFRGQEKVDLDDISLSGSGSESDVEEDSSESEEAPSVPQPTVKKTTKESKQKSAKAAKVGPVRDSTFLPSLMGGYISGSESASDIDVAPPKKRLGQRSRQAIAEKKYGARAKHLRQERRNGGRDAGWDMKRGAVEAGDHNRKAPWKKGGPHQGNRYDQGPHQPQGQRTEPRPTKRDDQGQLHPSWQAAKKAKEQKAATFSGQKIVFD